jgi:hypothetical protein
MCTRAVIDEDALKGLSENCRKKSKTPLLSDRKSGALSGPNDNYGRVPFGVTALHNSAQSAQWTHPWSRLKKIPHVGRSSESSYGEIPPKRQKPGQTRRSTGLPDRRCVDHPHRHPATVGAYVGGVTLPKGRCRDVAREQKPATRMPDNYNLLNDDCESRLPPGTDHKLGVGRT